MSNQPTRKEISLLAYCIFLVTHKHNLTRKNTILKERIQYRDFNVNGEMTEFMIIVIIIISHDTTAVTIQILSDRIFYIIHVICLVWTDFLKVSRIITIIL